MHIFEKVSVKQISVLGEILNGTSLFEKEFIEEKFMNRARNFDDTVEFMEKLNLVRVRNDRIEITRKYENFLNGLIKESKIEEDTKRFILKCMLNSKCYFFDYLMEFMSHFLLLNEQWEFSPDISSRLKYSGLRNLLMGLEFIFYDRNEDKYICTYDCTLLQADKGNLLLLSPEQFERIQERKKRIGRAAEQVIIEFEKERLSEFPELVKGIVHIAKSNEAAGYDINSFEGTFDEKETPLPRFIEVKAVSPWNYLFYWSKNEIEKSHLCSEEYYLYLLPFLGSEKFDINGLRIIRDPYKNVYSNEKNWIRTDELLSFSLKEESN